MGKYGKTRYPGVFRYTGRCGISYGIDYYADGRKHRETVGPLLGEARAKLEEVRARSKRGGFASLASQRRVTFDQLVAKYAEVDKGKPYFEHAKKYSLPVLLSFFGGGDRKLCSISPYDLEEFKRRRKEKPTRSGKPRSDVAVNRELQMLRHMFGKAVEWGMMADSPFGRFKKSILFEERNDRCRYLTEDEIKRLLPACPSYLERIVRGAMLTGLRKGDLLGLKWNQIDFERKILCFSEQKKGGKRGAKVLNTNFLALLGEIPRNGCDYIFTGPNGKPLKDVKRAFKTALKKAGIEDFHFHDLRHTSASYLVMRGASMKAVQVHLGHTSLAMTERYAHLSPDFLRSEVERLSGVFVREEEEISKKLVRNAEIENLLRNPNLPTA